MSELSDLIGALEAQPGKNGLMRAMLRAAENSTEPEVAVDWLLRQDPAPYDVDTRIMVAEFFFQQDAPEEGLDWCAGSIPRERFQRARHLIDMGELADAADHYAAAVAADPTLASPDIEKHLTVKQASGPANVFDLRGRPIQGAAPAAAIQPPAMREKKTFADVGGLDEVKKDIQRKIILPFRNPALFDKFKRKSGGGVLLYGPPGCGKTMIARATAGEVGASFTSIEIAEVLDMYIGQSEKRLAHAFSTARASKPTVLFFDEIEALAARRRFGSADHGASMVSTFLNEMDGVNASNEGLLVLAATNVPWAIDTAFRRPGRFDRVLFVPPPDEAARLSILELSMTDRPQEGVKLASIAAATSGFSGADLTGLVESACDLAIEDSLDGATIVPIKQKHLQAALKDAKPTTLEWLSQARNYAKYANEGGLYDDVLAFLDKHAK